MVDRDLTTNHELYGKLEHRRSSCTIVNSTRTPQVLASLLGTGNIPGDHQGVRAELGMRSCPVCVLSHI